MRDMNDFGGVGGCGQPTAQTYTAACECGTIIEVSTQQDDSPEYYTTVFVRCQCGKSVGFRLPVN